MKAKSVWVTGMLASFSSGHTGGLGFGTTLMRVARQLDPGSAGRLGSGVPGWVNHPWVTQGVAGPHRGPHLAA